MPDHDQPKATTQAPNIPTTTPTEPTATPDLDADDVGVALGDAPAVAVGTPVLEAVAGDVAAPAE
ncbi:hypothetical protein HK102_003549, partial [Quaeritorhiza haematococci]